MEILRRQITLGLNGGKIALLNWSEKKEKYPCGVLVAESYHSETAMVTCVTGELSVKENDMTASQDESL